MCCVHGVLWCCGVHAAHVAYMDLRRSTQHTAQMQTLCRQHTAHTAHTAAHNCIVFYVVLWCSLFYLLVAVAHSITPNPTCHTTLCREVPVYASAQHTASLHHAPYKSVAPAAATCPSALRPPPAARPAQHPTAALLHTLPTFVAAAATCPHAPRPPPAARPAQPSTTPHITPAYTPCIQHT